MLTNHCLRFPLGWSQADNFLFETVDEEDQEGTEGEDWGVEGGAGGDEEEEDEEEEFVDLDDM